MKHIFFFAIFFSHLAAFSQGVLKRDGLMKMDQGANAMLDGKYEVADNLFRESMKLLETLPSELAYYFGRNSYHLGKYKQSINWLNKYVELKGTPGKFFTEASQYLELSTKALQEEKQQIIDQTTKDLTDDGYFDCPSPVVMCPVCQGEGVIITPGKYGAVYQTCPVSGLSGKMTCDEYNAYIRGELDSKTE